MAAAAVDATPNAANPTVLPAGVREVVTIRPTHPLKHAIMNEFLVLRVDVWSIKMEQRDMFSSLRLVSTHRIGSCGTSLTLLQHREADATMPQL